MKLVVKENEKVILDFQKHYILSVSKPIVILCVLFLIIGILSLFIDMIFMGVFLIVYSIIMGIIYPIGLKSSYKKLNESNKQFSEEKIVEYEMQEEKFSLKAYSNDELINFSLYKYSDIFKIDETDKYFFVYISMNMCLPIAKEDIDENDISEIRGLMQSKCSKYKIFKYRWEKKV